MIKFVVLRTQDGHATDPLKPHARVAEGVAGYFEVLATGKTDAIRVSVDGVVCEGGRLPRWKADHAPVKAAIAIEQIVANQPVHTVTGEVTVGDEPPAEPSAPTQAPETPVD